MIAVIAILSPTLFLALQRANCDGIICVLVIISCAASHARHLRYRIIVAPFIMLIAAVLKLYPAVLLALFFLLARSKAERRAWTIANLLFAIYILFHIDEILFILQLTPRERFMSFGINVLPELLPFNKTFYTYVLFHRLTVQMVLVPLTLMRSWVILRCRNTFFTRVVQSLKDDVKVQYFYAGAAIYVFVFFVAGNNWAYRLMFLLLCLPQTLRWASDTTPSLRRWGQGLAILLVLALWLWYFMPIAAAVIDWLLCFILSAVLLCKAEYLWSERKGN